MSHCASLYCKVYMTRDSVFSLKQNKMTIRWSFPHCRHIRSARVICGKNTLTLHWTLFYNAFVTAEEEPPRSCTHSLIHSGKQRFSWSRHAIKQSLNPSISIIQYVLHNECSVWINALKLQDHSLSQPNTTHTQFQLKRDPKCFRRPQTGHLNIPC